MTNDTDTLVQAARLLYGDAWIHPLAKALGVNPRTMERVAQAHRLHGAYDRPIPPGWLLTLAQATDAHVEPLRCSAQRLRSQANERMTVPTSHSHPSLHPPSSPDTPLQPAGTGGAPMDRPAGRQ